MVGSTWGRVSRLRRQAVAVVVAVIGAVLVVPQPARAASEVSAQVWAYAPSTAEYRVGPGYAVNSAGGPVTVRRTGVGAYTVVFGNAATTGGVAHVVSYGGGPVICTVAGWYPSSGSQVVLVRCFAATGAPVDYRFVATFTKRASVDGGRLMYFYADDPAPTGDRVVTHPYRYDSTGGAISYRRLGTGRYEYERNPNPDSVEPAFPMLLVTAYNAGAVYCQDDWPFSAEIHCANAAGNLVDSRFVVTYGVKVDLHGHASGVRFATGTLYGDEIYDGRIWGDNQHSTLGLGYGWEGTLLGTGSYELTVRGAGTTYGIPFVNAHRGMFDHGPRGYCGLVSWTRSGIDEVIRVRCYAWGGVPANLNAWLSYTTYDAA